MIGIHNPKKGADIETIITQWKYIFKVGETSKFENHVGEYLLKTYGFLQRVSDKQIEKLEWCPRVRPSLAEAPRMLDENPAIAREFAEGRVGASKTEVQRAIESEIPDAYGMGVEKDAP